MEFTNNLAGRFRGALARVFGFTLDFNDARMSGDKAIRYAPVWYAINKISGHVSQLPLCIHRRLERGSERDPMHASHALVKSRPNQYQTAAAWKEQGMGHALLWGNWRSAILRQGGRPAELIPLLPDRTDTVMLEGEKWHLTLIERDQELSLYDDFNAHPHKIVGFPDEDVLHVPGFGFNGVKGKSLIEVAAESWDAGLQAEAQVRNQAKRGFSGSLLLQAPPGMFRDPEKAREFLKMFRESHDGSENAGKTGMLREGMTANVVAMSGRDSQWVEQRIFQRQEVAMWFCLEEIIGDDSSVSYNSLAEKHLAYLTNCLNKWLVKIEQECDSKLLSESEKLVDSHYFKFNTAALMRSDNTKTAEYLTALIMARVISPNEAREKLDMNPYDGGDEFFNPAITSEQPDDSEDEADDEDTEAAAMHARQAVASRVKHMVGIERQRVSQACRDKNFVTSVDKFYGRWETSMQRVMQELSVPKSLADDWCTESRELVMEVAGLATPDGLEDSIAELVAEWDARADALVDRITEAQNVGV